jgi:hypothetical protein
MKTKINKICKTQLVLLALSLMVVIGVGDVWAQQKANPGDNETVSVNVASYDSNPTGKEFPTIKNSYYSAKVIAAFRHKQERKIQPWTRVTHKISPELIRESIPYLGKNYNFEKTQTQNQY